LSKKSCRQLFLSTPEKRLPETGSQGRSVNPRTVFDQIICRYNFVELERALAFRRSVVHAWAMRHNPEWSVYIIRCDDGSLYTGVSTDVARRFREHRECPRGARYFNGRRPLEVAWQEGGHNRSSACRREAAIKKLSRGEKLRLIGNPQPP
jgi:putative endonuclease